MEANIAFVEQAIRELGSQHKLALAAGVSQPVVNEAKRTGKIGPRLAKGIEAATNGAISKSNLRPDLWPAPTEERAA